MASVRLSCYPCIDRTSYTLRAIFHGSSDDPFWRRLAASARQSALDMRVALELELYPPGQYSQERMANDIRAAADRTVSGIDALLVTIPGEGVADAVRYAAGMGMPVFGLNSGFEAVSGPGGLIEEGSVLFFTAMDERLGGEQAAEYFLRAFAIDDDAVGQNNHIDQNRNPTNTTADTASSGRSGDSDYDNNKDVASGDKNDNSTKFSAQRDSSQIITAAPTSSGRSGIPDHDNESAASDATYGVDVVDNNTIIGPVADAVTTKANSAGDNNAGGANNLANGPTASPSKVVAGESNAIRGNILAEMSSSSIYTSWKGIWKGIHEAHQANLVQAGTTSNPTGATGNETRRLVRFSEKYTRALFLTQIEEDNSAFQQRFEGYRDRLVEAGALAGHPVEVEWLRLDASTEASAEAALASKMSGCGYQSVLVGGRSAPFAPAAVGAVRANGCHLLDVPTRVGTFDVSAEVFELISRRRMDFAVDQHNYLQGWAPVHFAAVYLSTGVVMAPPPTAVYRSGPALFTQTNTMTDTLRICTDDAFPVCPNRKGPDGRESNCRCTERKGIVIGGVVHGITTDEFWDTVFTAAKQGADDMGIDLRFDRFKPQESNEILHQKMAAKVLSLCQDGVDGLFVSISSKIVSDAVRVCTQLKVPVMSINSGIDESAEMNLMHHVGMVERNAGFKAGQKMASLATFTKAWCLNHSPGLAVLDDRCIGFGEAMNESGIEYVGEVGVPDDNIAHYRAVVEEAVGEPGDWEGHAFLLGGVSQLPAALKLKELHPNLAIGSFDTAILLDKALKNGSVLFGIDQQAYLQGYLPVPILAHVATTGQSFMNHAIESGPSFIEFESSWNEQEAACVEGEYAVCPGHPDEDLNLVHGALIATGIVFFVLQVIATVLAIAWMGYYRKEAVVRASQPEFLCLVAIGCLIIASGILPLIVTARYSEYRNERHPITLEDTNVPREDIQNVDAACMAFPWLLCIGLVLIYSALVAKLRRIKELMKHSYNCRRVVVPRKKVVMTISCLLTVMVALLLTWQLVSPLKWHRRVTDTDYLTKFPTKSVGGCTSEGSIWFAVACACFIALCLFYAVIVSYKTRNMRIEFSESKYIAASVFYLLQLLVLAVPILVIARDNRNAYFIVLSIILFLMSFGTTILIFVPKITSFMDRERFLSELASSW